MENKTLVISGGGAKGAFALGILENKDLNEYNKFIGTSTGSLIAALLAIDKFDELKELYLNIDNDDIFDENFYNKKGKVKLFKVFSKLLSKKAYLGSFYNLLSLIKKYYTKSDHQALQMSNNTLIVCVTNLTTNKVEYKNANDYNWNEYTKWIWASTLAYPFTNVYENNGYIYGDGGYTVPVPIVKAVKISSYIDCIILDTEFKQKQFNVDTIPNAIPRIINVLLRSLRYRDIKYANHLANENNIIINYYYTPNKLTSNSMYFDKDKMLFFYNLGKNYI